MPELWRAGERTTIGQLLRQACEAKGIEERRALETYGIKPRGSAPGPAGPLTSYVTMRMENRGGAPGGTPELYFTDPDGLLIQLQDVSYCGGAGYLGNVCS